MKEITYDPCEDAAYIYFQIPSKSAGEVSETYCCDAHSVGGMINIDFDKYGKIFGIELIPASFYLSDEILRDALNGK